MQMLLNKMHSYCIEWKLNVNINKTKVMIFSKKKGNCNVEFKYGNNVLEVVESYTYLGLNLSCNGKLKLAIETLSNQATRAIFGIKKLYNYNNLDVYSKLKLFESIVVPILCYGCEVWGFDNVNDIEKIQIRFYKNILGLNRNTSNISVFGELGRYPLNIIIKERILKYWLKSLIKNDVRNKMYQQERYAIVNNNNNVNWASKVKNLLYSLGLNYIWDQQDYIHETQLLYYTNICKARLRDQYVQHFFTNISNNIRLGIYKERMVDLLLSTRRMFIMTYLCRSQYRSAFYFVCLYCDVCMGFYRVLSSSFGSSVFYVALY